MASLNRQIAPAASQRDQAYAALRRLLILQQIPEGQRLREPYWAAKLGVNRMALREAFARLEAEGIIERGDRTGYVVPVLTEADLREILRVRVLLEAGAIEAICESAARIQAAVRRLRTACREFERMVSSGYALGTSEVDRRFHETLIDAAENRRLALLYARAPLPLVHRKIELPEAWIESCRVTAVEHAAIADAIERGDARVAQQRLRAHLRERSLLPMRA